MTATRVNPKPFDTEIAMKKPFTALIAAMKKPFTAPIIAMKKPFTDPIGAKLVNAFRGPRSLWRTVGGVARQTGLTPEQVQSYIRLHEDLFVQSPITPGGIPLYGLRPDLRARFQEPASHAA